MKQPQASHPESHLPLGTATYHILLALSEAPLHGYGIMKQVKERTEGAIQLGPGILYGSIQKLTDSGLICEVATKEARRRCYELTNLGRRVAVLESQRLAALVDWARASDLLKEEGPA